ncbi:cercosporin resistance [Fusarium longipes]|uniref:Cercosporin resistance n=1 Tax=Fusarium longipes TaxID=694270 RepID=A0A395RJH9_9HYPO|nr:cercosporin resistance [Fusarium longipes]
MDDCLVSDVRSQDQCHKTRACMTCARLKMKCQWPTSGPGRTEKACSRCLRMKLECQVPEVTQRRKRGKSTRVAQLEKKIDGIVSLLAANQRQNLSPLTPESPKEQTHTQPQSQPISIPSLAMSSSSLNMTAQAPDTPLNFTATAELFPGFRVSLQEASERFDLYKRDYVPHFPFVPVPEAMTSQELYVESSLLFWTILAVVSPLEDKVQMEFKAWFRRYLAEHLIVRQEKSLDILQAMLIYLGWNDFHFYGELQVTNIVQLAIGLVIDLRLDKFPGSFLGGSKTLLGDAWTTMGKACLKGKVHQTPADKRAVLGVYHITNLLSSNFRKSTLVNWSTHLSQCCDSLLENNEFESDAYLVSLVRMQHMADCGFSIIPAVDHMDPKPPTFSAVTAMALDNVHRELGKFFEAQPERVKQTPGFRSHYNCLIVRLYEPILIMKPPSLSSTTDIPLNTPFLRAEYIWKCLEAVRTALEHHTTVPATTYSILPCTVTCILAFVTVTASRLILSETLSEWDLKPARRYLQFQNILQKLSDQFALADEEAARLNRRRRVMEDGSSVFLKSSFKTRWIRQWYMSKITPEEQREIEQAQVAVEPSTVLQNNPNWAADFQFDEEFWADVMAGYDFESLEKSLSTVTAVQ